MDKRGASPHEARHSLARHGVDVFGIDDLLVVLKLAAARVSGLLTYGALDGSRFLILDGPPLPQRVWGCIYTFLVEDGGHNR